MLLPEQQREIVQLLLRVPPEKRQLVLHVCKRGVSTVWT
jgi:hypothetical protein